MIEQRVTLRYGAQQIPAIVQAVQGDTGRDVIFELADYEIPAGATANYYIDKPDGNSVYNSAEVISSTEILAHLTEQALAAPGRNNGQVRILSDGEVITSFDFVLEVEVFRGILRLQSETEVNIFDQAIEDAVNTATEEAVAEIQAQTPVVTGMQNSIAPAYSSSNTYNAGDYVLYNTQLYRCISTITSPESWTSSHWLAVPISRDESYNSRRITSEKIKNRVIASNNILDFRSASGMLPEVLNGKRFYFGPGIDFSDSIQHTIPVRVHIEKDDSDLTGIVFRWALSGGGLSSSVSSAFDTNINPPTNAVGIYFIAYGVATKSPIRNISVTFFRNITEHDEYIEKIDTWDENHLFLESLNKGDLIIGEPFASSAGLMTNVLTVWGSAYPQYYQYFDIPVEEGEAYILDGMWYSSGYLPFMLCHNDRPMYLPSGSNPSTNTKYSNIIIIPAGVNRLIVNGDVVAKVGYLRKIDGYKPNQWSGKKIVWFGTSIPAGVINPGDTDGADSYPVQIGAALGATVYNEAVGSSCARAGSYQHISDNDPMGWSGIDARGVCLSLSLSSTEKQAMFDEWESKWKNIIPQSQYINLTDAWKTAYKNASWDNKLAKYLTGGSVGPVDMYVFDHGYNDAVETYGFSDLSDDPEDATDRTYFLGALAFLFKKILEDNPKATIIIIGHYNYGPDAFGRGSNFAGSYVCDAQEKAARSWGFPIAKTWEKLGISLNTIEVDGSEITVLQSWFPDKLHPASDLTGEALKHYADTLTPIIKSFGW